MINVVVRYLQHEHVSVVQYWNILLYINIFIISALTVGLSILSSLLASGGCLRRQQTVWDAIRQLWPRASSLSAQSGSTQNATASTRPALMAQCPWWKMYWHLGPVRRGPAPRYICSKPQEHPSSSSMTGKNCRPFWRGRGGWARSRGWTGGGGCWSGMPASVSRWRRGSLRSSRRLFSKAADRAV